MLILVTWVHKSSTGGYRNRSCCLGSTGALWGRALSVVPEAKTQKPGDAFGEMSPDEVSAELLPSRGEESCSLGDVPAP